MIGDSGKRSDEQWRELLTPEQFEITRRGGTEPAFTGQYYRHTAPGTYRCICCGAPLFRSRAKYDSGSGWPSFFEPASTERVSLSEDASPGMTRVEVRCRRCDAHLGHVFDDGPAPTGKRYCINSASLDFEADTEPLG